MRLRVAGPWLRSSLAQTQRYARRGQSGRRDAVSAADRESTHRRIGEI